MHLVLYDCYHPDDHEQYLSKKPPSNSQHLGFKLAKRQRRFVQVVLVASTYQVYDSMNDIYLCRHLVLEELDYELVSLSIGLCSRTTRELR